MKACMSPDRLLLSSGEDGLEPQSPNMVLSTIPVESSHVIIQDQTQMLQQQQQPQPSSGIATTKTIQPKLLATIKGSHNTHQQIVRIASPAGSATSVAATSVKLATIASTMPSSKLLVLKSNDGGTSTASTSYLNGQDGSKIVLVTTEQMVGVIDQHQNGTQTVSSNSTNDEELTSLTWLHDKNLLKGINLSCASKHTNNNNINNNNNNHLKVIDDVAIAPRQSVSGVHTPTSDCMDDSYVSAEENNSTTPNSSHAESGTISIYSSSTETSSSMTTAPTSGSYHYFNNNMEHHHSGSSNGASEYGGDMKMSNASSTNASTPHQHYHKKYIKQMNALNGSPITVTTVSAIVSSPNTITVNSPSTTTYTIPLSQDYSNSIKYADHETVIVENEYTHIGNHNAIEIDRTDDYVTPMSSPRHQQPPLTPQKSLTINAVLSPGGTSMTTSSVHSSPTVMPPVSPLSQNKQKHPNNLPYDPFIHTNNKPPLSFSSLIFLAIEDAQEKALPVKEIYAWIVQHYPYFKTAPTGWKNSVRHNLSLNKCFQKVEKAPNMGKGSLWRVEQQYKQNLVIALTRSSYHPNTTAMEKATASFKNTPRSSESPPLVKAAANPARPLDAELFPRLSKFMANMANGNGTINNSSSGGGAGSSETRSPLAVATEDDYAMHNGTIECLVVNGERVSMHGVEHDHEAHAISVERIARDWGVDNIDDVNAATAMLALKHGPKVFAETFHTGTPIITSVPSEDHTYSAGKRSSSSNGTSIQTNNNNVNIVNNNSVAAGVGVVATTNHKTTSNSPINIITSTNNTLNRSHLNNSDNTSNGTSSDAAYESSEESQNIISAEEMEARRHQEGVLAFLSFATEVSSMPSPIKRPPSADYLENIPAHHFNNNNNHIITNNNNGGTQSYYYYDGDSSPTTISLSHHPQHAYTYLSAPSPPKKSRTRTLRTKFKKKTWLR